MSADLAQQIEKLTNDYENYHRRSTETAEQYKKLMVEITKMKTELAQKEKEASVLMAENKRDVEEEKKLHPQIERLKRQIEQIEKTKKAA